MATLDLPTDPRTAVFRLIVAQLKADETLNRVINTWLAWEGGDEDSTDIGSGSVPPPALRLTPWVDTPRWYDSETIQAHLVINLDGYIVGNDIDDVLNLGGAIESALYPEDATAQESFRQSLIDAGAVTGLIVYHRPLGYETPTTLKAMIGETGFSPIGELRVDIVRRLIA